MTDLKLEAIRSIVSNKGCLLPSESKYLLDNLDLSVEHAVQCDNVMHDMEERLGDFYIVSSELLRAWERDPDAGEAVRARFEILRKLINGIAP